METQAKHTPTPWRVDTSEDTNGMIIRATTEDEGDSYEDIVAELESPDILLSLDSVPEDRETEAKANAEFIVKACNSYDKMRELLSAAYQKLYIADRIIDPYTEEDGEDIAGQLFSEGLADEIDTFLQNT